MYCCDIPESKKFSFNRHGSGKYYLCVGRIIRSGSVIQCRKNPDLLLSATTEIRKKAKSLEEVAGMVSESAQNGSKVSTLKKTSKFSSKQSLAESLSLLSDIGGETGIMMKDLWSIFKFKPLRSLHLGVSKHFRNCLIQYLSFDDASIHPKGMYEKQAQLSLLRMPQLGSCNDIFAHIKESMHCRERM